MNSIPTSAATKTAPETPLRDTRGAGSDTPETDAFLVRMSAQKSQWETTDDWAAAHNATLDHARKIERERNAMAAYIEAIADDADGCGDKNLATQMRQFVADPLNAGAMARGLAAPESESTNQL